MVGPHLCWRAMDFRGATWFPSKSQCPALGRSNCQHLSVTVVLLGASPCFDHVHKKRVVEMKPNYVKQKRWTVHGQYGEASLGLSDWMT